MDLLDTAKSRVAEFDEELMANHQDAINFWNCAEYSQLAIESLHWLSLASKRADDPASTEKPDRKILALLFDRWLTVVRSHLLPKLQNCGDQGYDIAKERSELNAGIETAEDWLESFDLMQRSASLED